MHICHTSGGSRLARRFLSLVTLVSIALTVLQDSAIGRVALVDAPTLTESSKFSEKLPKLEERPLCTSLYQRGGITEHSPLIFQRDSVMVCRTPKVGSRELRYIQNAYVMNATFTDKALPWAQGLQLSQVNDTLEFNTYLHDDSITRVMFVRHPVRRILSGFLEIANVKRELFWNAYNMKPLGIGPRAFWRWLIESNFTTEEYNPNCSEASTELSLSGWRQHWVPPQHCRCGMWDCGAAWKVYKIEEHSVGSVMDRLIPGPWNTPSKRSSRVHGRRYNEKDYLTPYVLKLLNNLTQVEQEKFGYEPLVID